MSQTTPQPSRHDFESVLAARAELGSEMEPALVDSFASQVTEEIRRQMAVVARPAAPVAPSSNGSGLALAIVSTVMLIPLVAITLNSPAPWMLLLILPTVAVINVAFAWSRRPR